MQGAERPSYGRLAPRASREEVPMSSNEAKYRIVVRHRPSRLTLARGLVGLEAALRRLDDLRAIRFHDRDAVFIVHERTGEPVDELAARAARLDLDGAAPPCAARRDDRLLSTKLQGSSASPSVVSASTR